MAEEVRLDGLGVSPGVLETIVIQAAKQIEGVESVEGVQGIAGLVSEVTGKCRGVDVTKTEAGGFHVSAHVTLEHGKALHEVARQIQAAVAEALASMTDQSVEAVDVYVDGVDFA